MTTEITAKNKLTTMLQEVWRKAARDGEGRIEFPDEKTAKKMKFAMYNAVKGVKSGKESPDAELADAVVNCMLRTEGATLIIERRELKPGVESVANFLGVNIGQEMPDTFEKQLSSSEFAEMEERLKRAQAERDSGNDEIRERAKRLGMPDRSR